MEYLLRAARTDVDPLVTFSCELIPVSDGRGSPVAVDLLRLVVHLPQASIIVPEQRRELVGGDALALRPLVRAGGGAPQLRRPVAERATAPN